MAAISRQVDSATEGKAFWLRAEISQIQFAASGHCYLDLIEQENGQTIAKTRAAIWKSQLFSIRKTLESDFKNILKQGTEIVFLSKVTFSTVYGLSVQILEIDAGFNLGLLERRKQDTIKKLKASGAMDLNKQLIEPSVIQRIALITSERSAAYEDFMSHLVVSEEQPYKFEITLFHSLVQGEEASKQMLKSLSMIDPSDFEAVVIIRGGGSKLDLEPFNDLELSQAVASFPLPVLTGIGHETDTSVLDMLVKSPHKTPTAVADYLVDKCVAFEKGIYQLYLQVSRKAGETVKAQQLKMERFSEIIRKDPVNLCRLQRGKLHDLFQSMERVSGKMMTHYRHFLMEAKNLLQERGMEKLKYIEQDKINVLQERIFNISEQKLKEHLQRMQGLNDTISYLKPENTLKRGFSIARSEGKSITSISGINKDHVLELEVLDGYIETQVKSTQLKKNGKKGN